MTGRARVAAAPVLIFEQAQPSQQAQHGNGHKNCQGHDMHSSAGLEQAQSAARRELPWIPEESTAA